MKPAKLRPSALHRYAEEIRSWINNPRRAKMLRREVGRWNQLCSCLDTLQQTELAMQAYASTSGTVGSGQHYLALYGLLQAMVLQQDAVCHLDEALGGKGTAVGNDRHLQDIRKIRNVSVGHPTKVDRRDVMSHHHISRPKIGKGFELVSAFDDGRRQFTFVSLSQLLRKQKLSVARMLRTIVKNLDTDPAIKTVKLKTKHELVQAHRVQRGKESHRVLQPRRRNETSPLRVSRVSQPPQKPDRRRVVADRIAPHLERRRSLKTVPAKTEQVRRSSSATRPTQDVPRRGMPIQSAPAFRRAQPPIAGVNRAVIVPQRRTLPPLSA
jgi:hypothetical protein